MRTTTASEQKISIIGTIIAVGVFVLYLILV